MIQIMNTLIQYFQINRSKSTPHINYPRKSCFRMIFVIFLLFFSLFLFPGCQKNPEINNLLPNNQDDKQQENKSILFKGISFSYTSSIGEKIIGKEVPANIDASGFLFDDMPSHVRFDIFNSYIERMPFDGFQYEWLPWLKSEIPEHLDAGPQIFVFPITGYTGINPMAEERIDKLMVYLGQNLLPKEEAFPVLPTFNSTQDFRVQAQGIIFKSGRGLRFITRYSQETKPIINPHVFYTFQGLSEDNRFYVAAFFPLYIPILPDQLEIDDWEKFNLEYKDYLKEVTSQLEVLDSDDFEPNLILLDDIIESISIDLPSMTP